MRYARRQASNEPSSPPKRRLKRKPLVILIGILFFFNLLWFIAWLIPSKSTNIDEEVASVNGKSITRDTWMAAMEEKVGRETLQELINQEVMEAAAKEYGIKVSNKEIDLELALIHSFDQEAYTGLAAEKERDAVASTLILEKVLTKDIVIDDDDIKKNYEDNAERYHIEDAYRTSLIVVSSLEDAQQTIQELKDGSNFAVLAKELSIDATSGNLGGDIGYINESSDFVDPAIVEAASKLKKGEISDPIALKDETYAIVLVDDQLKGKTFKFKEVKEHIRRDLALKQLPEKVSPEAFWKDFDAKWFYGE